MRVLLRIESTTTELGQLRALLGPGVELVEHGPADVLVTGRPSPEDLAAVGQALVIPYSGLARRTQAMLLEQRPELPVYNLHHAAPAVAEHALALLLACSRWLLPMDRALRQQDWRPRYAPDPGLSLAGRTALVLGLGAVGGRLVPVLQALGLEVLGLRRRPGPGEHGPDQLDALLPRAQVLVACLPHTRQTSGLLDARRLALLPDGALLVNIGRAQVIDEEALFLALRDGPLHAAGLDVWYRYPQDAAARRDTAPSAFPFHELDKVVLSPHRAGHGVQLEAQRRLHLARTLNSLARGEEPAGRVDVAAGY